MKNSFALLAAALLLGFGATIAFARPDAAPGQAGKSCCAVPAVALPETAADQPAPKSGMACHPGAEAPEAGTSCHASVAKPKAGTCCPAGKEDAKAAKDGTAAPHQH